MRRSSVQSCDEKELMINLDPHDSAPRDYTHLALTTDDDGTSTPLILPLVRSHDHSPLHLSLGCARFSRPMASKRGRRSTPY